jgi:hypothetical protein
MFRETAPPAMISSHWKVNSETMKKKREKVEGCTLGHSKIQYRPRGFQGLGLNKIKVAVLHPACATQARESALA